MKLNAQTIRTIAAPEGKTDFIAWDDAMPGFGLRLRGEKKTWVIQYRIGQQQRRESLGALSKVTLEAARNIAKIRFAQVQLGTDPGAEKKARGTASAATLTLGNVAARYLDAKRDVLRPSTFKSAERHFGTHWAPLTARPLVAINRAEIAARLQEIVKEYGRTAAARARSTLSSLFSWSMREGLCGEANPVIATNDPGQGASRDRVLTDRELAAVWNACGGSDDFSRIVRLLILTAARRDEIGSLRWSEINGNSLTIAAERSKNRKAHTLTLPPMALDILESVPRRDGRDYVFGQRGGGFARWGFWTTKLRGRLGQMPAWTLHDLRRSAATGMAEIGVQPHIIEAVLNHVSGHKGSVAGIYNRAAYAEPMRAALQRWADHVAALLDGRPVSNVTPLRRA
jgi:integrase